MTFARQPLQWFDDWIFRSGYVTARGLGAYRIFFTLFLLLFFTPWHKAYGLSGISELPESFVVPPLGPMMLLSAPPSGLVLEVATLALAVALVCVLFGWHTRTATVTAALLLLLLDGFANSFGKINHGALIPAYVMGIMVFAGWGRTLSLDSLRDRERGISPPAPDEGSWAGPMAALLAGLMLASAGLAKASTGAWLSLDYHATENFADLFLFRGDGALLTEAMLQRDLGWLWELGDYFTLAFELGFVVAALRLAWLRAFCAIAIVFHTLNYLILGIDFLILVSVYALFLPWEKVLDSQPVAGLARVVRPATARLNDAYVPLLVALPVAFLLHQLGSPLLMPLDVVLSEGDARALAGYGISLAVIGIYLGHLLRRPFVLATARAAPSG